MRARVFKLSWHALALVFLVLSSAVAQTPSVENLVAEAGVRYQEGNFLKAAKLYRQALAQGAENGHLFYNLANAEYRLGNLGVAIAEYRRALKYLPQDPDVLANLSLARRKVAERWEAPPSLLGELARFVTPRAFLSEFQLQFLFLLFFTACCLTYAAAPLLRRQGIKHFQLALTSLALYFALLTFGTRIGADGRAVFAFTPNSRELQIGVITAQEAKVYSGNAETFEAIAVLTAGVELDARGNGEWVEILIPNGRRGFVKREEIALLNGYFG